MANEPIIDVLNIEIELSKNLIGQILLGNKVEISLAEKKTGRPIELSLRLKKD